MMRSADFVQRTPGPKQTPQFNKKKHQLCWRKWEPTTCHLSSFSAGQAADPKQEGMGGHQEEPLSPILGEEGPGDSGSLPSGAADGGMGEKQRHHTFGGSGDHGSADRGVSCSGLHFLSVFCCFPALCCDEDKDEDITERRGTFSVLFHGVSSAHPLVCVILGTGGRFSCYVIISSLMSTIATVSM